MFALFDLMPGLAIELDGTTYEIRVNEERIVYTDL